MWLYVEKKIKVQYIGKEPTRALTSDWKKDITEWQIFETSEKEALQLLRLYWYLYEIVSDEDTEENTTDNTDISDNTTDETNNTIENSEEVENSEETEENEEVENEETDNTEDVEEVENEEENNEEDLVEWLTPEEVELIWLRKAYKEKYNQEVPVNKKNDINWIKSKL